MERTLQMDHAMAEEKRASREGVLAWAAGSRYRRLVGFVRRVVGDQGEAEDVVQEALFRALGSWGGVRSPERLEAWLFRICRHAAIDHIRFRSVRRSIWISMPEDHYEPEERVSKPDQSDDDVDLSDLPTHHRLLMDLHYSSGYSHSKLCRMSGLAPSALRVRLFRSRGMLLEDVKKRDGEEVVSPKRALG